MKIFAMETLVIYAESDKINALIQLLKAFDISYEKHKTYKKEFFDRVLKAEEEVAQGKGIKIPIDDLWK